MLRIAGQTVSPRLVVLDKDGTLIAFHALWRAWFDQLLHALRHLAAQALMPFDAELDAGLAGTLGYDLDTGEWDPVGPLTLASTREVALLIAGQIYRYRRIPWDQALQIVTMAEDLARGTLGRADLIRPIGNACGTLQRLRDAGILLALATADDRQTTERMLEALDLRRHFATIVCGDDGVPPKPAPDMAQEVCRRLGVAPAQAIMIGDTIADLIMARQAGYRYAIAVTSGALPRELLAPYADLIIPDINAIEIVTPCEATQI